MKRIESPPNWREDNYFFAGIELFSSPDFQSKIKGINEQYSYWDKIKYQKDLATTDPKIVWSAIKIYRSITRERIQFGKHRFQYSLLNPMLKAIQEFDLEFRKNVELKDTASVEDRKRHLISSIMEEAIASSQIEGAVTTRKKAKEMLRKNTKPRNKSEQMILNNYRTITHIVEIKDEPITLERLFEVHKLIANQTLEDVNDEGKYRDNNDVEVEDAIDHETVYSPPDFKEVPEIMDALFQFFNSNDEKQFIHPIVKGCIIHFIIGYIHPFVDGNGRTARALFYWYLLKNGYWLTEYLSISRLIIQTKTQYAEAFIHTELDENDLTYFINYKVKTMQLAYESLKEYLQRKANEKKQLINFTKIKGINERQALIINWLFEEPDQILSVKEIENRFNVANQTARTDLTGLESLGYLELVELNKKSKGFCKSERFDELLKAQLTTK
jgi:Fic family protein